MKKKFGGRNHCAEKGFVFAADIVTDQDTAPSTSDFCAPF